PGNIRELQNAVERSVILSQGKKLALEVSASGHSEAAPAKPELPTGRIWQAMQRENLLAALRQAKYRVAGKGGAAEMLGVSPTTLSSRMKAIGINRVDFAHE